MQCCSLSCHGFSSAPIPFFKIECPAFGSWLPGRLSASLSQVASVEVLAAQGQIQLQITPGCPSKPHLGDAEFSHVAVHPAWLHIFPNRVPKAFTYSTTSSLAGLLLLLFCHFQSQTQQNGKQSLFVLFLQHCLSLWQDKSLSLPKVRDYGESRGKGSCLWMRFSFPRNCCEVNLMQFKFGYNKVKLQIRNTCCKCCRHRVKPDLPRFPLNLHFLIWLSY